LYALIPNSTANGADWSSAYWLLTRCSVVKEPGSLRERTRAPEWGASQYSTTKSWRR